MKTTGSYDWVISTWVKQEQAEGGSSYVHATRMMWRNGAQGHEGRRMFFKGDTIYSYHEWWPMAKILNFPRCPGCLSPNCPSCRMMKIALINREKYSVTTTDHTNQVESALRRAGFACFAVERQNGHPASNVRLEPDPSYLLAEYKRIYDETRRSRDRLARDWGDPLGALKNARQSYVDFCNRFGFAIEFDLMPEHWQALNDRVKEYKRRAEVKRFAHRLLTGEEAR